MRDGFTSLNLAFMSFHKAFDCLHDKCILLMLLIFLKNHFKALLVLVIHLKNMCRNMDLNNAIKLLSSTVKISVDCLLSIYVPLFKLLSIHYTNSRIMGLSS